METLSHLLVEARKCWCTGLCWGKKGKEWILGNQWTIWEFTFQKLWGVALYCYPGLKRGNFHVILGVGFMFNLYYRQLARIRVWRPGVQCRPLGFICLPQLGLLPPLLFKTIPSCPCGWMKPTYIAMESAPWYPWKGLVQCWWHSLPPHCSLAIRIFCLLVIFSTSAIFAHQWQWRSIKHLQAV